MNWLVRNPRCCILTPGTNPPVCLTPAWGLDDYLVSWMQQTRELNWVSWTMCGATLNTGSRPMGETTGTPCLAFLHEDQTSYGWFPFVGWRWWRTSRGLHLEVQPRKSPKNTKTSGTIGKLVSSQLFQGVTQPRALLHASIAASKLSRNKNNPASASLRFFVDLHPNRSQNAPKRTKTIASKNKTDFSCSFDSSIARQPVDDFFRNRRFNPQNSICEHFSISSLWRVCSQGISVLMNVASTGFASAKPHGQVLSLLAAFLFLTTNC